MRDVVIYAALVITLGVPAAAQQQNPDRITVPLSDPSRPGTLKVKLLQGTITIKGANRKDVVVEGGPGTDLSRSRAAEPPPGFRRLTQPAGFTVTEDNNVISVSASLFNDRAFDLRIEVPMKMNLNLSVMNGGPITVDDVEGELEISHLNGSIALTNVAGSVVAHSLNGNVTAVLARVAPQAPMSFTSMNGTVDVTLPPDIKANLKLRSDQGDVFTNFALQVTSGAESRQQSQRNGRGIRIDVNRSIYGTINGGGPDVEMRTFHGNVYVRKGK